MTKEEITCDRCECKFVASFPDEGDPMPIECCFHCGAFLCSRCLTGSGECLLCRDHEMIVENEMAMADKKELP